MDLHNHLRARWESLEGNVQIMGKTGVAAHCGLTANLTVSRSPATAPAGTLQDRRNDCGIPFWPHGFVRARCDTDALVEAWNNEDACPGYGALLCDDPVAFCELTGVREVAL